MPPSPTGNICADLLNRAEWLFQCAKMREDWDNEWLPGRHKTAISQLRSGAQKALTKFGQICASCTSDGPEIDPINTSY